MAYFTGSTGKLLLEQNEIARVQNWSISSSVALVSVKTLSETDDNFEPVSRSTTGSCRVLYYQETLGQKANNSASTILNKIFKQRDLTGKFFRGATLDQGSDNTDRDESSVKPTRIRLKIDDGSTNGKYIEMRIFITNVSMTMSVGEVVAADIQFQSQGAPILVEI